MSGAGLDGRQPRVGHRMHHRAAQRLHVAVAVRVGLEHDLVEGRRVVAARVADLHVQRLALAGGGRQRARDRLARRQAVQAHGQRVGMVVVQPDRAPLVGQRRHRVARQLRRRCRSCTPVATRARHAARPTPAAAVAHQQVLSARSVPVRVRQMPVASLTNVSAEAGGGVLRGQARRPLHRHADDGRGVPPRARSRAPAAGLSCRAGHRAAGPGRQAAPATSGSSAAFGVLFTMLKQTCACVWVGAERGDVGISAYSGQ